MSYISEHKTGFISTICVHAVVLLILLLFGFFTPLPLPQEEGILVNFGDSETGLGLEEPAPNNSPAENVPEEKVVAIKTPVPVKKVAAPKETAPAITQDFEKTAALEEAKKKKQEEDKALALATAQAKKAGEISNRAKNAFGGNSKGTTDSKSTSQGVTYGTGNQGTANGSANVDKYGPGGGVGNGPSYSLDGRTGLSLPKPYYPGNEEGIVVVQVTVDNKGIVTKVEPGVKGSNTANSELIAAARKAALQAKFNVDNNAPAFQVGTITYHFRLD